MYLLPDMSNEAVKPLQCFLPLVLCTAMCETTGHISMKPGQGIEVVATNAAVDSPVGIPFNS